MATKNPRDIQLLERFGKNVRSIRKLRGLTMQQLAYRCDVELGTISAVERSTVNCSISTAHVISKALGVKLDTLVNSEDDMNSFESSV